MRYADILPCEICNGHRIGVSLFCQGCRIHCKNCFNQSTWDFNGGKPFDDKVKKELFSLLERPYIDRISILGGEPLCDDNAGDIKRLIEEIRDRFGTTKKIWLYTGYTIESLTGDAKEAVWNCDVVVDGPFVEAEKDLRLAFKGSKNQRIINIPRSKDAHQIVEMNF